MRPFCGSAIRTTQQISVNPFPLDSDVTVEIARAMRIRHPRYADGSYKILNTDLLVTKRTEHDAHQEAVSVRLRREKEPTLSAELKIVERYWNLRGVPWRLHLNNGLNENWARNLDFLYAIAQRPARAGEGAGNPSVQHAIVRTILNGGHTEVGTACGAAMEEMERPPHHGVNAFHLLLAAKRIRFNLDCKDVDREPVSRFIVVCPEPVDCG